MLYGACFGIELTVNSFAALYFIDKFHISLGLAGLLAGLHGMMNLFARKMGGNMSDRLAIRFSIQARVLFLFSVILLEGITLFLFGMMNDLTSVIIMLLVFSLFVQLAAGATYSIVPFLKNKRMGIVSGIVGAGGNLGAIAAAFLFGSENMSFQTGFQILGLVVTGMSGLTLFIRFSPYVRAKEKWTLQKILATPVFASQTPHRELD